MKNRIIYKSIFYLLLPVLMLSLNSCNEDSSSNDDEQPLNVKIAVFSDPHYFDVNLGTSGNAFQEYVAGDRKLIAESKAITESLISSLISEKPGIVIVSGDLTKDGELASHQEFAKLLKTLETNGSKVYVVPGNHDVSNPETYSYSGDNKTKVENVSPAKFIEIYNDFGYGEAIAKDPNSLTYIAQPANKLWILAMDACRYKENTDKSVTSGKFSAETLSWIKAKLQEAKNSGITVIGTVHHGVLEHFAGQKTNPVSAEYVIDDWETISKDFADLGLKVVLTGHFHANDIVRKDYGSNYIYDVETGSTVTYPCPYRILNLNDKTLAITTKYITSINFNTNGKSFPDYAKDYIYNGMVELVKMQLMYGFGVSESDANTLSVPLTKAFMAHYAGDETLTDTAIVGLITMLKASGNPTQILFGSSIEALFTDIAPADNTLSIGL